MFEHHAEESLLWCFVPDPGRDLEIVEAVFVRCILIALIGTRFRDTIVYTWNDCVSMNKKIPYIDVVKMIKGN